MKNVKKINPESLKVPTRAYSQGVVISLGDAELMYVTGQLSQDVDGNVVAPNDTEAQTKVVFSRIEEVLKEGGMTMDNVVKIQIFIKNITESKLVSALRDEVFKNVKPVSTLVEVSGFIKEDCTIEIEATAYKAH
ncbi:enamine/imine deaminase [bacterium BMS3Abin15]|nr:enamine/imine deaminase [bacterium BMS3Abin15]